MASWRDKTKQKYAPYLNKWYLFCKENRVNVLEPTINDGLKFLTEVFKRGSSYSVLNSVRSALSTVFPVKNGLTFGKSPLVSKFLKGVFNLRPSLPMNCFIWEVKTLFDYYRSLPPNRELSLKAITMKLATILCLLCVQRSQSIH